MAVQKRKIKSIALMKEIKKERIKERKNERKKERNANQKDG